MKSNAQFAATYKRGRARSTQNLTIVFLAAKQTRAGFSINKKIGKAVIRNKLKRQLRACVGQLVTQFANTYHIVFVPKPALTDKSYQEICSEVTQLLIVAGILPQ